MVASLQKSHFHGLEILSISRYSNRAVESLTMNNDNKPPARTEKRKPQDGKLQSYLEWPNALSRCQHLVSRSQTLFFLLCRGGKEKGLVNIVVGLSRGYGDSTAQLPDC